LNGLQFLPELRWLTSIVVAGLNSIGANAVGAFFLFAIIEFTAPFVVPIVVSAPAAATTDGENRDNY